MTTKLKETFDNVEKFVKKFKIKNEIIVPPERVIISKLAS